jgi:hypothetical protein
VNDAALQNKHFKFHQECYNISSDDARSCYSGLVHTIKNTNDEIKKKTTANAYYNQSSKYVTILTGSQHIRDKLYKIINLPTTDYDVGTQCCSSL